MTRLILRRLFLLVPVLLGISIVVFSLIHLAPGDPAYAILGVYATKDQVEALREDLGLDRPMYVQYLSWLGGVVTGDLGVSLITKQPVTGLLRTSLPITLWLAGCSLTLATLLGGVLGVLAAVRKDSWLDNFARLVALLGVSMPTFWMGIMLILGLAVLVPLFPAGGAFAPEKGLVQGVFRPLLLPAVTLGLPAAALVSRMVRSTLVEVLQEDFIRTAWAKGLRERTVVLAHGLRNALMPTVTVLGFQLGYLLGGAVLVEKVFALPGIGWTLVNAVTSRDYSVVQAVALISALGFVFTNLLVDAMYALLDPRIRWGGDA